MSIQSTEYIVRLRDLASGALNRMGATGASAFQRVAAAANNSQNALNRMPASIADLNRRLDDLRRTREVSVDRRQVRQLSEEIDRVEGRLRRLQGGGGSGMGLGGLGVAGLLAGAGLGAGALIGGVAQEEQNRVSMEVLTGSPKVGNALFDQVKQFAMTTPYMQKELLASSEMMLGFGIAAENVMPSLKMLGDIARGDAARLGSLSLAYSQVMSAGKLQGQDLLQFINAGFNPLNEISKMTGRSMGELRKQMEQGGISATMVAQAFQHATSEGGLFYGMTDRMSQTFSGRLSTLKDNAMETGKSLMDMLMPALNGFMSLANVMIEFKGVTLTVGLAWLAYSKYQTLATFATQLFSGALFTVRGALIATGIGALVVLIGFLVDFGMRVAAAKDGTAKLKDGLIAFGTSVKTTFQIMGESITYALESAWLRVKGFFGNIIDKPAQLLKAIAQLSTGNFTGAAATIKGLFTMDEGGAISKAMADSKAAHEQRMSQLKAERATAWNTTKNTFAGFYAKPAGSSETGGLNMDAIAGAGAGTADLANAVGAGANSLSNSGPRSIVVNIGKFQDSINIYAQAFENGLDDLDRRITETLLRVVNSAAAIES